MFQNLQSLNKSSSGSVEESDIIRKRIELSETEAFFFFTSNNTMPPSSSSLRELYSNNKDEDGFLYLYYCGENVFGSI